MAGNLNNESVTMTVLGNVEMTASVAGSSFAGSSENPAGGVPEAKVANDTTASTVIPMLPTFTEDSLIRVTVYSVLFVIAAVGNLTVFITLFRTRRHRSRINLMIMHLAIADLIVTFFMIPLEVGWRLTVQWLAGDIACKAFLFFRAFGLYLSSMVLVCVSLDRYFAILHPLRVNDAQRRGKIMLLFAWAISILCSVPQSVVFHVQRHPVYPFFEQCVTFNSFPSHVHELIYNIFCMLAMYGVPLLIIVFVYTRILCEISKKSRETKDVMEREECFRGRLRLRRSDMSNIERARTRTLRMTIIIVMAFIWCWTPYFVMTMWYMFDRESAQKVDNNLQESLFMFAVSNSCVNPLVYGTYAINFRREFMRCLCRKKTMLRRKNTGSCMTRISRETTLPTTSSSTPPGAKQLGKHAANGNLLSNQLVVSAYASNADLRSLSMISERPESSY